MTPEEFAQRMAEEKARMLTDEIEQRERALAAEREVADLRMLLDNAIGDHHAACQRARDAEGRVSTLEAAVDDLWSCLGPAELDHVQPETEEIAQEVHNLLWHHPERTNLS
jgi:hypothetical protein